MRILLSFPFFLNVLQACWLALVPSLLKPALIFTVHG
jgi:hypothetical protein